MLQQYLTMILKAPVYDVARETPLDAMPLMSARLGNQLWLKREDLQPVFSYKVRGAYNRMVALTAEERARGVITASAGNHAQGVALAASRLGVKALIVMPTTTPEIKVNAVRRLKAEAVLVGNTYDDAAAHARELEASRGLTYIPPYDHPLVIAGQGTVAMEILRQHPAPIDAIFVPVGGGGLIAGVAAYVKALTPETRIIGVEADEATGMTQALAAGERVMLDHIGNFADGTAVRQVGAENFRVARELVDGMITVSIDEICAAVKDIFEETRAVAEPSGALALAGAKQYVAKHGVRDQHLVTILSGANVNFDRLRYIAELAELGEQREVLIGVTIPERPGSFLRFCRTLGRRAITEFNYRYADDTDAHIFVGVQLRDADSDKSELLSRLREQGFETLDMTGNELAKQHVRYMVGGHAGSLEHERLLRVEFPERPGALLDFLEQVGDRYNISLFHYRNHGAAYGRVLMGIQVPPDAGAGFARLLENLGMDYIEEPANAAYDLFLR